MKLINALTTAIAGSILCAGSAIAAEYSPTCPSTDVLVSFVDASTVLCQSRYDADAWSARRFYQGHDELYRVESSVRINRDQHGADMISVHSFADGAIANSAIFWREADGTITGTDDQDMMYAASQQDRINELLRSRRYWIGY